VDPATDSIRQFLNRPQAKRLLAIARSDNPVLALDVVRRERSWTQAMGWLLDPQRDPKTAKAYTGVMVRMLQSTVKCAWGRLEGDPQARRWLSGLRSFDFYSRVVVESAATEQRLGRAGRVDVLLRCRVGATPVTVLIENKIDTQERVDQLDGYVRYQAARQRDGGVMVPLLIELGDTPRGRSSCPWAVCWGREEAARWLQSVNLAPSVAGAYTEVFEAWDLGSALSRTVNGVVDDGLRSGGDHPDLRLIRPWLSPPDVTLYREIAADRGLGDLLDQR